MITGRVKYPNNKMLKIAMGIIIGTIVIIMIFYAIFSILCYITCGNIVNNPNCY